MLRQLTHAPHGHILANSAVWSPDGEWLVYDVRSDSAGSVFDGTRIERVHVATGEVQVLYESRRGACCGAPLVNPVDGRVAFILGPEDPTPDWQYCAWHRRGVIVDPERPGEITNLDARDLTLPFTPGALRGGSHVHQFSPYGRLVSFTYEDHVLAQARLAQATPVTPRSPEASAPPPPPSKGREQPSTVASGDRAQGGSPSASRRGIPDRSTPPDADFNQRNIAVAFPRGVEVPRTDPRNHDGEFFTVVATQTVNHPRPGSNEITRAYEEAWLPSPARAGTRQRPEPPRLAFLGDCLAPNCVSLTELFLLELPSDLTQAGAAPLEGTPTRRPAPPAGVSQRRLTFTADREFPGLAGADIPRFWPRSSPAGDRIAFLMRDDAGVVQLWSIPSRGGNPRQLSRDPWPIASAFTWNHDGTHVAYVADSSVMLADAETGATHRLTPRVDAADAPRPEACVFSPDGRRIAFLRQVNLNQQRFNQIHVVDAPRGARPPTGRT